MAVQRFNDFFSLPTTNDFFGDRGGWPNYQLSANSPFKGMDNFMSSSNKFSPQIDLYDKPDRYEVVASVPGTKNDNLNIDFDPDSRLLTISGQAGDSSSSEQDNDGQYMRWQERWQGSFERSIRIPKETDIVEEDIGAKMKDGVLRVNIPKEAKPEKRNEKRRIKVE